MGSSEIGAHSILANIHAEELAITFIKKYLYLKQLDYNKYKKNIKLIIWKINSKKEIKPAHCCQWCAAYIKKHKFPITNVITVNNECAIQTIKKIPLKRKEMNRIL